MATRAPLALLPSTAVFESHTAVAVARVSEVATLRATIGLSGGLLYVLHRPPKEAGFTFSCDDRPFGCHRRRRTADTHGRNPRCWRRPVDTARGCETIDWWADCRRGFGTRGR